MGQQISSESDIQTCAKPEAGLKLAPSQHSPRGQNEEPQLASVRDDYERCFQDYLLYRARHRGFAQKLADCPAQS